MSPSLSAGKPGLNTATVRPAQVSPAKRFVPHYIGEPIAGHATGLKNPDGSWVAPGGKFQPGASSRCAPTTRIGSRPTTAPGRRRSSTQWNAAQVAAAKQIQARTTGCRATILRSLLPGGLDEGGAKSPGEAVAHGADIASLLVPGGRGRQGRRAVRPRAQGLRGIKGVKAVAEAVPAAAHATEEAAAVRGAMPGAKIVRGKQEAGYSVERAERSPPPAVYLDNPSLPPAERVAKAKAELRGELPKINYRVSAS